MLKCVLATLIAAVILQAPAQNPVSPLTTSAVIDKVVLEPDDESPVRVQVWGTFNGSRGFLYLQLPPFKQQYPDMMLIKLELRRVKATAGTGTIVQFQSSDVLPLRPEADWPIPPANYPPGFRALAPAVKQGLSREEITELLKKL